MTGVGWAGEDAPGKTPLAEVPPVNAVTGSHFRISVGAAYRSIDGVEFHTGSRSGRERLPFPASALRGMRSRAGAASGYADREYENGYVFQDEGTAKDGGTWYWGYDEASQLSGDGDARFLTFQGQGDSIRRESRSLSNRDPGAWETDGDGAVPVIQLDWGYDLSPGLTAGLSLRYSFLGFDGRQSLSNFAAGLERSSHAVRLTDTYDLDGIIAPSAPYEGGLEGPGAVIENRPTSRVLHETGQIEGDRTAFFNRIEESLDVKLHTLAFGPTLASRFGRVDLAFGAGLALNIVDWEATHTETLFRQNDGQSAKVYKQWTDRSGGTDVLPGVYIQVEAGVRLTERLSFTAFGQYDWSDTLTGGVGPSRFTIDPSGWTAGGMLGFAF